jgi:ketosteroid isomerase-like protein
VSRKHLDVVRQALEAVRTCDEIQATELFDPDAEWHNTSVFPGERVWRGPQAIIAFWRTFSEAYAEGGTKIERYRESERWVVAGFHSWGRGRASGAPLDVRWAAIFELRDRRVTRVEVHGSYAEAIEAAELRA